MIGPPIVYRIRPSVTNDALNALFGASWPRHAPVNFLLELDHSLTFVCAYQGDRLVGFVNLAWDGGCHAFVLNPTVHPDLRRRGIGRELVRQAVAEAELRGIEWVHVDFEPYLREFYRACEFWPTEAGLLHLGPAGADAGETRH